jgi:RHS repeat-associated protein
MRVQGTLRKLAGGLLLCGIALVSATAGAQTVSGTLSLGGAALSDVTFTATNGVTCTILTNAVDYSCSVPSGWSGSVTPSRGGVSFTPASRSYSNVTANQTAQNYTASSTTTLSVSPTSVFVNGAVTATWSGTPGPSGSNWLGLFNPGAPSTNFYLYSSASANGQASGSVSFPLPASATPGTYELRLFGGAVLAISNSFTVVPLRTVSGTVTLAGSALSGVAFAATNGVTCTTSDTSGQYSCSVPSGWSGSVTPSRSGFSFTPASRTYNNVTSDQTAQDFTATNVGAAAVYYIHPDHLNTPRLIANSTGTTVWRWDQGEPFGNDVPNNNPSGQGAFDFNLRFPGQYFDRETNLAYNMARDYDPATGRYVESDPIGLDGGLNTYLYVAANPITGFDPSGTQTIIITPNNQSDLPNDNVLLGLICMGKCLRAPINLESGTRTPAWDKDPRVGGSGSGPHTRGNAADVIPMPSMPKLRKAAAECGFYVLPKEYRTRPHVHIEMRGSPKEDPDECVCKQIREGS